MRDKNIRNMDMMTKNVIIITLIRQSNELRHLCHSALMQPERPENSCIVILRKLRSHTVDDLFFKDNFHYLNKHSVGFSQLAKLYLFKNEESYPVLLVFAYAKALILLENSKSVSNSLRSGEIQTH